MHKYLYCALAMMCLAAGTLSAEQISWSVVSSSGATGASSSTYRLGGTMGQPAVSSSSTTDLSLRPGFWQLFSAATGGCCSGQVGDANGAGGDVPTLGDVSALIDAVFITAACDGILGCLPEADANRSGGASPACGDVTLGDISVLIDFLFIHGPYDEISNPQGIQLAHCL